MPRGQPWHLDDATLPDGWRGTQGQLPPSGLALGLLVSATRLRRSAEPIRFRTNRHHDRARSRCERGIRRRSAAPARVMRPSRLSTPAGVPDTSFMAGRVIRHEQPLLSGVPLAVVWPSGGVGV